MSVELQTQEDPLRVIHIFRAPLGGLFRHVCDLIHGQKKIGLSLGLLCDVTTGDEHADSILNELAPLCTLGVHRIPMSRRPGWSDVTTLSRINRICTDLSPDIVHGHGAKGGAYARLVAQRSGANSIYTPHGGSLHYSAKSPIGFIYLSLERILQHRTGGLIFESQFGAQTYRDKIGAISCSYKVIHNGLHDSEFSPVLPDTNARDFVFVGELRKLKGLEALLQAVHKLRARRNISLLIAGAGPDAGYLQRRIAELDLGGCITLSPAIFPATRAFSQGRCIIIPSLAESFPYIVLEAAAAKMPILATNVGGIPEIFGPYKECLLPPGDPVALAQAMEKVLDAAEQAMEFAESLQAYVKENFSASVMLSEILQFYREVLKAC